MGDSASLAEFAAFQTRPRTCSVCGFPKDVLTELNAGLVDGIGPTTAGKWLRGEGHKITEYMVSHHRTMGHHEEDQEDGR